MNLLTISLILVGAAYVSYGEVTEQQKREIVRMHNQLRREVATGSTMSITRLPKAANMRKMSWNEQLAERAQNTANKCIYAHDKRQDRKIPKFESVGQNIYKIFWFNAGWGPIDINVTSAVEAWFNEFVDYGFGTVSGSETCTPGKPCGHLTQVVWGDTYEVGCGMKTCTGQNMALLFCNYGPAGNFIGQLPYTVGDACTKCITGDKCEKSLCVPTEASQNHKKRPPTKKLNLNGCLKKCIPPGHSIRCSLTTAHQNQRIKSNVEEAKNCIGKCIPADYSATCTFTPI